MVVIARLRWTCSRSPRLYLRSIVTRFLFFLAVSQSILLTCYLLFRYNCRDLLSSSTKFISPICYPLCCPQSVVHVLVECPASSFAMLPKSFKMVDEYFVYLEGVLSYFAKQQTTSLGPKLPTGFSLVITVFFFGGCVLSSIPVEPLPKGSPSIDVCARACVWVFARACVWVFVTSAAEIFSLGTCWSSVYVSLELDVEEERQN